MVKLARLADSLRLLQAVVNQTVDRDDENTYDRSRPSLNPGLKEQTPLVVKLSS